MTKKTGDNETNGADDSGGALSRKLSEYLEGAFESVCLTRQQHFDMHPGKRPNHIDIDSIITSYANQNAAIAAAANLFPGPWGALTIAPEITFIIRNQIQMIYDIGVAHGKEAHLSSHTLLAIFSTVIGGGAIGVAAVRGGQLLVKRASLRVIQQVIKGLGGKVAQRVLRGLIARWIPIVGIGVMAVWARQSTKTMGRKASELLGKDIVEEAE
jgi:uncharacterized protein (DUF697 family)